jgi:hypothetical protein
MKKDALKSLEATARSIADDLKVCRVARSTLQGAFNLDSRAAIDASLEKLGEAADVLFSHVDGFREDVRKLSAALANGELHDSQELAEE